ncbi:MAG TPA: hypothetical protein VJ837_04040 [Candidatus Paceibacterota bacterium]|nr:hypothetical protein [Candidatus Paceibacterota bacterium]
MMRSRAIRRTVLSAAVILVLGYALFEARGLLRGPVITIETPRPGETLTDPLARAVGRAENVSSITMNSRAIFISEKGRIDEPLALLPGYNEITFLGTDRFGKTVRVELMVLYRVNEMGSFPVATTTHFSSTTTPAANTAGTTSTTTLY